MLYTWPLKRWRRICFCLDLSPLERQRKICALLMTDICYSRTSYCLIKLRSTILFIPAINTEQGWPSTISTFLMRPPKTFSVLFQQQIAPTYLHLTGSSYGFLSVSLSPPPFLFFLFLFHLFLLLLLCVIAPLCMYTCGPLKASDLEITSWWNLIPLGTHCLGSP